MDEFEDWEKPNFFYNCWVSLLKQDQMENSREKSNDLFL